MSSQTSPNTHFRFTVDNDNVQGEASPASSRRAAPQLASLDLPSPGFGRSFEDLVASSLSLGSIFENEETPVEPTKRLSSRLPGPDSHLQSPSSPGSFRKGHRSSASSASYFSVGRRQSLPRPTATDSDLRVRRWRWSDYVEHQREQAAARRPSYWAEPDPEVWMSAFPQQELRLDSGRRSEVLSESDIEKVTAFLGDRGYTVDSVAGKMFSSSRNSDSFPLLVKPIALDGPSGGSDELDIIEHLSTPGTQSNAFLRGAIPIVPITAIMPYNDSMTLVAFERWMPLEHELDLLSNEVSFKEAVQDLVSSVAFLHAQRIAHLSITPASVFYSSNIIPPSSVINLSSLRRSATSSTHRKHFALGQFQYGAKLAATAKSVKPSIRINNTAESVNSSELKHYQGTEQRYGLYASWITPPELTGLHQRSESQSPKLDSVPIKGIRLDPYALDIYSLGQLFKHYSPALSPEWIILFDKMTLSSPSQRITAAEALVLIRSLV